MPFLFAPAAGPSLPFVKADGTAVTVQNECNFESTDSHIELIDYRFVKNVYANLSTETIYLQNESNDNSDKNLEDHLVSQGQAPSSNSMDTTICPMFDSLSKFGDINFIEKKGKNHCTYEQYMKLPEP